MIKSCGATLAVAVSILLGLHAVAGADEPRTVRQHILPFIDGIGGHNGAANRVGAASMRYVGAVQLAKADLFESSMTRQESAVRRQLGLFVKKHKTSDIGYPATAKVTNIQDYQVIKKDGDIYEVNIRYQVVASVDTATFEDVFTIHLGPDGSIDVLEMH